MSKLHYYHAVDLSGRAYTACGIPTKYRVGLSLEQWGECFAPPEKVTYKHCRNSRVFKYSIGQRSTPI